MNLISKILVGALVIAVAAVVWFLLTRKRSGGGCGGCGGDCAGCAAKCGKEKK